ncbi:FAD-dependent monooxygenase [Curtobacterium sp. L1-20]|uniref:FAD-dependent monooxygenase n=1 Tax=Curtobacterium sp. L1-20 TaxID=3138181 RepID=UPI003B529AF5
MPSISSPATVVVVGAGPTGLWLAAELATAGVETVVLEKRTERSPYARALGVMPRTLDVLALRGVAEQLLAVGRPVPAWHFGLLEESVRFDTLDTPHPFMLLLPQTVTERILEDRARSLGVTVLTGATVTGIDETDDGVTATYDLDGVQQSLTGALVIGTDGAQSAVRTLAGIPFEGETSTAWGFIGDVRLEQPPAPGTRIVRPDGALIVAPLPDGRFRLTGWDPQHQSPDEQLDLDTLRDFARRMAGTDFGAHDPSWLSRFGNANRLAATFRRGRVLLAGDAAHIHWPTGGLGLNAGVQDAMSLGWRAAGVVQGTLPDSALDDYAAERRSYGEALRTSTLTQSALIVAADPAALAIRATFNRLLATNEGNRAIGTWLAGLSPESTLPSARVVRANRDLGDLSSRSLSGLFVDAQPVVLVTDPALHATISNALDLASDRIVVALVEAEVPDSLPAVMVFRPDGVVEWASSDDVIAAPLNAALRNVGALDTSAVPDRLTRPFTTGRHVVVTD